MACLLSGGVKARVRVSRVRVGARLGPRLRLRLRASSERRRGCARCACIPPWRRQQRRASLHLEVVGNVARLTNDVLPPPMGEDEQRSSGGRAGGEDGQVARRRHRVGGKRAGAKRWAQTADVACVERPFAAAQLATRGVTHKRSLTTLLVSRHSPRDPRHGFAGL